MKGHKTKNVKLNGEVFSIDEKLVPLIKELNKAGLVTLHSCQRDDIDGLAYVMFDLDFITSMSVHENKLVLRWRFGSPITSKVYFNYNGGCKQ